MHYYHDNIVGYHRHMSVYDKSTKDAIDAHVVWVRMVEKGASRIGDEAMLKAMAWQDGTLQEIVK